MCLVVCTRCSRGTSVGNHCVGPVARRSQMSSRPATTFSGNSFCRIFFLFSFFLFSHRESTLWLVRIVRRTACKTAEARGRTCALLYAPAATRMPVLPRVTLLLLRIDRKRQVGQQQHSQGILFVNSFFLFSFLAQRERVLVGADCWSNDTEISRSRSQDLSFVVWT